MAKKIFKEQQRFSKSELVLVGGITTALVLYKLGYEMFISGSLFFNQVLIGLAIVATIGLVWWFVSNRLILKTAVTQKGIQFKMAPFHNQKRRIRWEDIRSCSIVKTSMLAQFHGANISFSRENYFSLCGRNGVKIETRDGAIYFIGSRRPEELKAAIEKFTQQN